MNPVTWLRKVVRDYGLEYFSRYYGIYRGTIASTDDPEKLGRVQLKVPVIYGNDTHNYWAVGKGMYAGQGTGLYIPPMVGDSVFVSFENGDPRFPIWEHGWFNNSNIIQEVKNNYNQRTILKTLGGSSILIDDSTGEFILELENGFKLVLNKTALSLVADKVSIGSLDSSSESAVLGEKNETLLNSLIDSLTSLHTTLIQLSGAFVPNPAGAAIIAQSVGELGQAIIELNVLKTTVAGTKSKKVTIDE